MFSMVTTFEATVYFPIVRLRSDQAINKVQIFEIRKKLECLGFYIECLRFTWVFSMVATFQAKVHLLIVRLRSGQAINKVK
jgi:hypothetical protein